MPPVVATMKACPRVSLSLPGRQDARKRSFNHGDETRSTPRLQRSRLARTEHLDVVGSGTGVKQVAGVRLCARLAP